MADIARLLRKFIEVAVVTINKTSSIQDAIIISGTPRSGTTWLMEILETLNGYRPIFEPLHPEWFPEVKQLGFQDIWHPYVPYSTENPALTEYMERVLLGIIIGEYNGGYSLTPVEVLKRLMSPKPLVKFVRANRLLPWILEHFQIRHIYLIIRHPGATVASQLKAWGTKDSLENLRRVLLGSLENILEIQKLSRKDDLIEIIDSMNSPAEISLFHWALDQYIPLTYLRGHHKAPVTVLFYENLLLDYETELRKIFGVINEDIPAKTYSKHRTPSRTASDTFELNVEKQLSKWKAVVQEEEFKNAEEVFKILKVDFYSYDSLLPDTRKIKYWRGL